jgi:hypothetical protein
MFHSSGPLICRCSRCGGVLGRYQEGDEPADWFCVDCHRWRPTLETIDDVEAVLLAMAKLISDNGGAA